MIAQQRKQLPVSITPFWDSFDPHDNLLTKILDKRFHLEFSENPAVVFFGTTKKGVPETKQRGVRVCYIFENQRPDFEKADWFFSHDYDDAVKHPRHLRLPIYAVDARGLAFQAELGKQLVKPDDYADRIIGDTARNQFCAYVAYTNQPVRLALFDRLSRYSPVIAPGRSRNNADPISDGDPVRSRKNPDYSDRKLDYLKNFKFCLSCENASYPGYTTEKIVDAMRAGCVPIYWGNPKIEREFNPHSFVNANEFERREKRRWPVWIRRMPRLYNRIYRHGILPATAKKVTQSVAAINESEDLYREILSQPWFNDNKPNPYFDQQRLERRLFEIAEFALQARAAAA